MRAWPFFLVPMKEMSWLWRRPTAIASFHRLTRLSARWISSTPSSLNRVLSTSFHGQPNRQMHAPSFLAPVFESQLYLVHVGLWTCRWTCEAQKLASFANCAVSASRFRRNASTPSRRGTVCSLVLSISSVYRLSVGVGIEGLLARYVPPGIHCQHMSRCSRGTPQPPACSRRPVPDPARHCRGATRDREGAERRENSSRPRRSTRSPV